MSGALYGVKARVTKFRLIQISRWRYVLASLALVLLGSIPAAAATIFVDWQNLGPQNGTAAQPYRTLLAALAVAAPGDTFVIRTGAYSLYLNGGVLNKPATFRAENGPVTINNLSDEWPVYRYNNARTGAQPWGSALSDPARVGSLRVVWQFPPDGMPPIPFRASPIVVHDMVFIGGGDGFFYALDAARGTLKWRYPTTPLIGSDSNWHYAFESSASYLVRPPNGAVIFGAQDPSLGPVGSGARLFALDAQPPPTPIWLSDPIATVNGDKKVKPDDPVPGDWSVPLTELHQRMTWSAPLIFNNRVYVGVHDFGDSPIQAGRVKAVDLATGHLIDDRLFHFQAAGTPNSPPQVRGGGVWNALATDGTGVYFTTGNTRMPWALYPYCPLNCPDPFDPRCLLNCPSPVEPEPSPNHGLSLIRIDKDTGSIVWKYQPVPFRFDGDPDWAAGATVMSTSCGGLIASVQKDGWSYAIDAERGPSCPLTGNSWQFPPTTMGCPFTDPTQKHGDDDYRRPGAAWNDVFIVRTGGENLVADTVSAGYDKLHALNACATTERDRVRWIADVSNIMCDHTSYSAPTVTGGIVVFGTNQDPADHKGHLVVFGDPSVGAPSVGWRCSNTHFTPPLTPQDCTNAGYSLVPNLTPLADVAMPDGGSLAAMRNEPVLAKGRVFVATYPPYAPQDRHCGPLVPHPDAGHVYMLEP